MIFLTQWNRPSHDPTITTSAATFTRPAQCHVGAAPVTTFEYTAATYGHDEFTQPPRTHATATASTAATATASTAATAIANGDATALPAGRPMITVELKRCNHFQHICKLICCFVAWLGTQLL